MPRGKKFTAEQIIEKLCEAEVELARGKTGPEVVRKLGVTEQTYCRWKREYGGLRTDQATRLKDLEQENARPRCGGRTPGMPGAWAGQEHATPEGVRCRRRAAAREADRLDGQRIRPLRISQDYGPSTGRRLVGEPQACGADLATGGPESACETAEAAKALAWRWVVHPASADALEPRLEPRLRDGPDPPTRRAGRGETRPAPARGSAGETSKPPAGTTRGGSHVIGRLQEMLSPRIGA